MPVTRNCSRSVPWPAGRRAFRHDDEQDRRGGEADAGQPEEQALPAHERQRPLDRQGRRHRARAARHHVEAGDEAPLARRIPQREDLDRRHQAAGEADADQHARHDQLAERGAEPEQRRADRRHDQQHGLHPARAVAVERHALDRLDQREEQEEGRGQQAEIGRGDADVALEIGEDDRVDAAEDVRKEVGERERQEDLQQQLGSRQTFLPRRRGEEYHTLPAGKALRLALQSRVIWRGVKVGSGGCGSGIGRGHDLSARCFSISGMSALSVIQACMRVPA